MNDIQSIDNDVPKAFVYNDSMTHDHNSNLNYSQREESKNLLELLQTERLSEFSSISMEPGERNKRICGLHKELMSYICLTDSKEICKECYNGQHKDHSSIAIDEAELKAKNKRTHIKEIIAMYAKDKEDSYQGAREEAQCVIDMINTKYDLINTLLERSKKELCIMISDIRESNCQKISTRYDGEVENLKEILQDLKETQNTKCLLERIDTNVQFSRKTSFELEEGLLNRRSKKFIEDQLANILEYTEVKVNEISGQRLEDMSKDYQNEIGKNKKDICAYFSEGFETKEIAYNEITIKSLNNQNFEEPDLVRILKFLVKNKQTDIVKVNFMEIAQITMDLGGYDDITDSIVTVLSEFISSNISKMQHLHLDFANCNQVTDSGLNMLSENIKSGAPKLKHLYLNLNGCDKITDTGVITLSEAIKIGVPRLRELDLNPAGCNRITDPGVDTLSEAIKSGVPRLQHLRLNLTKCNEVTDVGVKILSEAIEAAIPKLNHLYLSFNGCDKVTDIGLGWLSEAIKSGISQLEELNLIFAGCDKVTDLGVKTLCEVIKSTVLRLQHLYLDFADCSQVTDLGVYMLSQAITDSVQQLNYLHLDFNGCSKITDLGLKILSEAIKSGVSGILDLNLRFNRCGKITDSGVNALCEAIQSISPRYVCLYFNECDQIRPESLSRLSRLLEARNVCVDIQPVAPQEKGLSKGRGLLDILKSTFKL